MLDGLKWTRVSPNPLKQSRVYRLSESEFADPGGAWMYRPIMAKRRSLSRSMRLRRPRWCSWLKLRM
jgi:hypothetical protein